MNSLFRRVYFCLLLVTVFLFGCESKNGGSTTSAIIPDLKNIRAMSFRPSKGVVHDPTTLKVKPQDFHKFLNALSPVTLGDRPNDATPAWDALGTLTIVTNEERKTLVVYYAEPTLGAFSIDGQYYRGGKSARFVDVMEESCGISLDHT